MKCLYISYDGILEPLGQSQIIPYLKGLSRRGIKFILLTFDKKHYRNKKEVQELCGDLDKFGIKWFSLRYHKYPPVVSTLLDIFCGFVVSLLIIMRERPQLVHARSYVSSTIALGLKKMLGLKFIFDMRGFWADERVEGKLWARRGVLYYFTKFLEKHFFKNADEIVVLTERAKKTIQTWGYDIKNVSVIPCCVDTDRFKFDNMARLELRKQYNLSDKLILVHTGSLEYWYMIDEALNFFMVAKKIEPRAHFLILTHADKDKILQSVYDKSLNPEDFTVASVAYSDMPRYLTMVDAGLILITPVFSKTASFPTKFAEYLSCSVPVIINEGIGDLEDYVLSNNLGVVVRDFNQVRYRQRFEELLNLLRDRNLRIRCRQIACENFDLNGGVEKYYRIYTRLR